MKINRFLKRTKTENQVDESHFYAQVNSCQIGLLWFLYEQYLSQKTDGIFVEVGGYDGLFVSNSWGLARAGWTGYLIEPNPLMADKCRVAHSLNKNVSVTEVAIGPVGVKTIDLQLAGTLSTANPTLFDEYKSVEWAKSSLKGTSTIQVNCITLDEFIELNRIPIGFDVLIVDVEGFESEVFSGFTISNWKPKMIIVELVNTHPDLETTRYSDAQLQTVVSSAGYQVAYKDSINTVFVSDEYWFGQANSEKQHQGK
jgi:FkbM family methyltransferase